MFKTIEELIGQTLVFGIPGTRITPEDVRLFKETHAAGLILYRINFSSPSQLRRLISDLENALERRLLVTVDHEGGRVVMFGDGVTVFPDNLALGRTDRTDWAARQGRLEARELRRYGVDVNFAPTLDVLTEAFSPNIGIRSYGDDVDRVTRLGLARLRALQENGVSACAKHFPGLGPSSLDPHLDLPRIDLRWRDIRGHHLRPFQAAIDAGVDMVMSSHPLYPHLDPTPRTPATFSRRLITDLLRREMGFRGVVASDDLEMGALRHFGPLGGSAVRTVKAGHDLLLCCHRADLQRRVFKGLLDAYRDKSLSVKDLEKSVERIQHLRRLDRPRFQGGSPRAEPGGASLARAIARRSVWTQDTSRRLPLRKNQQIAVLFPRFSSLAERIFIEKSVLGMETNGLPKNLRPRKKTDWIPVPLSPQKSDIRTAVQRAGRADAVVFFCYDAHLDPAVHALWKALRKTSTPRVVVFLRDPYDRDWAAPEETLVTAFGFRQCQIDATLATVFQ